MKKLCILSPDTINLPLTQDTPEFIQEGDKKFLLKDKCVKAAATGTRAQKFAENLCKDFDVTILIPDLNFPPTQYIDFTKLNYSVKSYNFKKCQWKFSQELDEELKNYDVIIIQTTAGVGFINVGLLPYTIQVIVDGWVPFLAEYPASLSYHQAYENVKVWHTSIEQYECLIRRANLILYANEKQKFYYEGQLFAYGRLSWKFFKNSPLLKIPYGIEKRELVQRKEHEKLRLLWYGPFYPWYDPKTLIDAVKDHPSIELDFYGVKHPRYTQYYEKNFKDSDLTASNMKIVGEFSTESPAELFSNYDACIIIAQDWIENTYCHRARFFEILSYGMPLIVIHGTPSPYDDCCSCNVPEIHYVNPKNLKQELEELTLTPKDFKTDAYLSLQKYHSWEKNLQPLKDYLIENFK